MSLDEASFELLLEDEGRKDAAAKGDPGGRTFCGIDAKDDADWTGWPLLDQAEAQGIDPAQNSTIMAQVRAFYDSQWASFKVDALPPILRRPYFGACVNEGPGRATELLQQAINTITGTAKVAVDGVLGDATVMALVDICLPGVAAQFWQNRSTRYTWDAHHGEAGDLLGFQDRLVSGL